MLATLVDGSNVTHTARASVAVFSASDGAAVISAIWDGFTAALAENPEAIDQYLSLQARTKLDDAFTILRDDLPAIVSSFSAPTLVSVDGTSLGFAINRPINGQNVLFFIYASRGPDGVWRLDEM